MEPPRDASGPRGEVCAARRAWCGALARVHEGGTYYVDSFGRVLVGWHGTTTAPQDMAGHPMVRVEENWDSRRQPFEDGWGTTGITAHPAARSGLGPGP